jgi:hypothetical protein
MTTSFQFRHKAFAGRIPKTVNRLMPWQWPMSGGRYLNENRAVNRAVWLVRIAAVERWLLPGPVVFGYYWCRIKPYDSNWSVPQSRYSR